MEHRRCGCPEQYKNLDCPACRGTGLIPPVTREEWLSVVRVADAAKACVQNPAWRGVCDEDVELEHSLRAAGLLPANSVLKKGAMPPRSPK